MSGAIVARTCRARQGGAIYVSGVTRPSLFPENLSHPVLPHD